MAKREASYLIDSIYEERERIAQEKANKEYQLSRRINKMSPLELYDYVITTGNDVSKHLHLSNNQASWSNIYSQIMYVKNSNESSKTKVNDYRFLLKQILTISDTFINRIENVRSIATISFYYLFRLRDIETWIPKRISPIHQLDGLIEHLYSKYKVPKFLYKGFHHLVDNRTTTGGDHTMIELFLHIGSGVSFKKFDGGPRLKINNKFYHYLFSTPEHLDLYKAFRRAQILSMGGDNWLFETFMDSKLNAPTTSASDEFWVTVIQFFITNSMVDETKIKEIIDYIEYQKFQRRFANGIYEAPPQPNFTMKGRTVDSLIRMSDNWHRIQAEAAQAARIGYRNNRNNRNIGGVIAPRRYEVPKDFSWDKATNIRGFVFQKNKKELFDIIELVNSRQLRDQSESQRNCVYSYASSCASGTCRIFTLRLNSEPLLTIEAKGYRLVQIKGKCNRLPTESEMRFVKLWADKERLIIG